MKLTAQHIFFGSLFISTLAYFVSCGGSSSSSTSITTASDAMANLPNVDPTSVDYSLTTSTSTSLTQRDHGLASASTATTRVGCFLDALYGTGVQSVRRFERMLFCKARGAFALAANEIGLQAGGTVYISFAGFGDSGTNYAKITNTAGEGLGSFKIYQCSGSTQVGYATFSFANNTYSGTGLFRRGTDCSKVAFSRKAAAVSSSDFSGSLTANFSSSGTDAILKITADGATKTNTVSGKKSDNYALGYWSALAGCGTVSNGTVTVSSTAFAVSASATGEKTYSDGTDSSLCSHLPEIPTVVACPTFAEEGGEWDCDTNGKTVVALSATASQLEDAGGSHCKSSFSDAWESRTNNPGSCF